MEYINLIIGIVLISIALILTLVAAELYDSNLSFIWGVFVGIFCVFGARYVNNFIQSVLLAT